MIPGLFRRLPRTNLPKFLWQLWAESYIVQSIVVLGVPIIIGQLGSIAQQFADTIMVGQYGTVDLAAAGFVNNVFNFVIYFILGFSYASTPVIGAAFGRKDNEAVTRGLVESIAVNLLVSLVVVGCLMLLYWNIGILDQPEEILPTALPYFLILTASVPFMAVFNALKQFSDAIGETRIPMWIMLFANALNIVLNWLMIFVMDMGLYGAGIATLISRIISVIILLTAILYTKKYSHFIQSLVTIKYSSLITHHSSLTKGALHLLFLGLPISIQLGLEASSFNVCAIFMGWLGAIPLAAHQVMCTISTLCFQVMYGIGAAASVLIAQFRGVGDWYNVRRTATRAFALGISVVALMVINVYIFRHTLAKCFTTSQDVIAVLMTILPCFFLYQIGDCTQIIFANALRGIEQVRKMMLFAFIAYICVSIPLSYIFGFVCHWGSVGVWMGLPFGLTTAGVLFYTEFRKQANK